VGIDVLKHALMITGFVFVMMLVIEYVNVLTSGVWEEGLARHAWGQYILAAALGATPGCLGAFAVVGMYSHGVLTFGAVVAAMIATSGDESFVMLAMIPKQALLLTGILFVIAVLAGALTDFIARRWITREALYCDGLQVHAQEHCQCFARGRLLRQWKECSAPRGILCAVLAVLLVAVAGGHLGPPTWNWVRVTLLVASAAALFIVSTVPDHFLQEHLWQHVVMKHVPRVFLWTLGALVVMTILTEHLHLESAIHQGKWLILAVACLVGLIPESGPHLIFVTLYAKGAIPLSILLASSIVQDGHGMLPMLAHSRRGFLQIKGINLLVGLLIGALCMALGF